MERKRTERYWVRYARDDVELSLAQPLLDTQCSSAVYVASEFVCFSFFVAICVFIILCEKCTCELTDKQAIREQKKKKILLYSNVEAGSVSRARQKQSVRHLCTAVAVCLLFPTFCFLVADAAAHTGTSAHHRELRVLSHCLQVLQLAFAIVYLPFDLQNVLAWHVAVLVVLGANEGGEIAARLGVIHPAHLAQHAAVQVKDFNLHTTVSRSGGGGGRRRVGAACPTSFFRRKQVGPQTLSHRLVVHSRGCNEHVTAANAAIATAAAVHLWHGACIATNTSVLRRQRRRKRRRRTAVAVLVFIVILIVIVITVLLFRVVRMAQLHHPLRQRSGSGTHHTNVADVIRDV